MTAAPDDTSVKNALIVDDEPANRDFLLRLIEQAGFKTYGAASGKQAIETASELTPAPQVLIIDSQLPDTTGLELIKTFREKYPPSTLIMATMLDVRDLIATAFEHKVDVFLVKPHGFMELFRRLQQLDQDPDLLKRIIIDSLGARPYR